MKVWTCNRFTGHYPVGCAAVVYAETQQEAVDILNASLKEQGLEGDAAIEDMELFPCHPQWVEVRILCDGQY
jgi:hypothetical protein